jgi:hypothetical protein
MQVEVTENHADDVHRYTVTGPDRRLEIVFHGTRVIYSQLDEFDPADESEEP